MTREILTLKQGESVELDIEGKIIEVQAEQKAPMNEHIAGALVSFSEKLVTLMPELKGEKGDK